MFYDSIDQSQFSEQNENYPVLEEDFGQETTTIRKKSTN